MPREKATCTVGTRFANHTGNLPHGDKKAFIGLTTYAIKAVIDKHFKGAKRFVYILYDAQNRVCRGAKNTHKHTHTHNTPID